jgi:prepilin-type N-terminal cleavage/methylation domain-containing protein
MISRRVGPRGQAGFSFIEILVVMAIITVLVGAVVVVIPRVLESSRQTQSINNVRNMLDLMLTRQIKRGWQPYNGKNFVLYLVAAGEINRENKQNLEVFFSPGDELYKLASVADPSARYGEINTNSLKTGDFHELTSYAGRRNAERDYLITPERQSRGVPIISDDDDGPLHHPSGLIMGYTNRNVRLMEWEDLGIAPPADVNNPEALLGDSATSEELRALSSTSP